MALHFENEQEENELHEINVTPFIDIMLVLLIVFMIAAPLATVDIHVNLPTSSSPTQPREKKPIYISIKNEEEWYIDDQNVSKANFLTFLEIQTQGNKAKTLFFRADKSVKYEVLINVMDLLRDAGYSKIALVGLATR